MKGRGTNRARRASAVLLLGVATALGGCADPHSAPVDGGADADSAPLDTGNVITFCPGSSLPLGAACSFEERCIVLFTDWVDGMCGDEGYECVDGRVTEYEHTWACPSPDSPCSEDAARAEDFSLGEPGEGALGVAQACTSSTGWGDCVGGHVHVELLDDSDLPQAQLTLTFDDQGDSALPRTCLLVRADAPEDPLPCTFVGRFAWRGCSGLEVNPAVCGDLSVELDGMTVETTVALTSWRNGICF